MPVEVRAGDLFQSRAQTLVNTVNCVGVMGKGVALEFKRRFPEMYADYVERCRRGEVRLGRPYLYRHTSGRWILNFPTKDHWRSVARLDDIVRGLKYLLDHYREWGITSLAVPPLGCGQGGLDWKVVGPTLYRHLKQMDIPVELYAPLGTPKEWLQLSFMDGAATLDGEPANDLTRLRPAWVALAEILHRLEKEPYHWPTGRVIFQKLAYLATESGLPTGLAFTKGSYGPFSSDLKAVTAKLVNNGVIREQRRGSMIEVVTGPTFRDARKAYASQLQEWEPVIDRVANLLMRLDTRHAELVATVVYAAQRLIPRDHEAPSEMDVLKAVMDWKVKRNFEVADVATAIRSLAVLGWIDVRPSAELPLPDDGLGAV